MRMRYTDVSGVGYHRHDCAYTMGLLAMVPQLFGLPLARVRETSCGVDGAPCCDQAGEARLGVGEHEPGPHPDDRDRGRHREPSRGAAHHEHERGEVTVLSGQKETTYNDPVLVKRLLDAAN